MKKLQNTKENKARFFNQYHSQIIQCYNDGDQKFGPFPIGNENVITKLDYLELTSLSNISDEDAIEVAKICGWPESHERFEERVYQFKIDFAYDSQNGFKRSHKAYVFDYLRSKGYALPWMNLSVEELLEYGWIRIKK